MVCFLTWCGNSLSGFVALYIVETEMQMLFLWFYIFCMLLIDLSIILSRIILTFLRDLF